MRNTELFLRVAEAITLVPERWSQELFFATDDEDHTSWENPTIDTVELDDGLEVHCGSTMCAAGWAVSLADKNLFDECAHRERSFETEGARVLGLDATELAFLFYDVQTESVNEMVDVLEDFAAGRPVDEIRARYNS